MENIEEKQRLTSGSNLKHFKDTIEDMEGACYSYEKILATIYTIHCFNGPIQFSKISPLHFLTTSSHISYLINNC